MNIGVNSPTHLIVLAFFVAFMATFLTRSFAYFVFKNKKPSTIFSYLQQNMGLMIMVILVFYALGSRNFNIYPQALFEIVSLCAAVFFQIFTANSLFSIAASTSLYMVLLHYFV